MIDTMYIFWELEKTQFKDIRKKISSFTKLHIDKNDKNSIVTYKFAHCGFQEIRLRANKLFHYWAIEIHLRPKLLVDSGNYINVTHSYELEEVRKRFNCVIQKYLQLDLPDFLYWKAKRIDYAIDLLVDQNSIPIYMFLFKKGNIPKIMLYHDTSLKYFDSTTNVYLKSKNITINWYDRYSTLEEKQEKTKKKYSNIKEAKNLLRFEIQCNNLKIDEIDEYSDFSNNSLFYLLNVELCQKKIEYYYDLIVGPGKYYTLNKAIEIIDSSIICQRKRMLLRRILESIARTGSVWKAKEEFINNQKSLKHADKEFSKRLNQIRKLNINPVTIPNQYKIEELENIQEKIKGYFLKGKYRKAFREPSYSK
ncbi:hypothetical protein [Aneurinibacillus aneurinilyticus]|uniref:Uncharacterized protein n=1 Tax=Aneurinibacillus aneurinilyticus ATCC 12856 TaxID=649747 RepID=U1WF43_ANEAE|nr:hypothetical protein [Aneurinibacillus aneurinilyticus]ERI07179.1 hypothetical protein HMPREF0083_04752 [Aneurinibacillus aneurinilyticus ATCC 12856]MED0705266.1 hypothetical protein [Aneurinibacillus aneurinilyticus]MED0722486.1 hypothetical protein [Aneurinibacillus aneurinilyticus]MED0733796.1 hypothetical protein [Aneurinibacillus aneurinilyticus]MED0739683.1 hypothetical protein [Aneurinibacillus aneurinilyticus]